MRIRFALCLLTLCATAAPASAQGFRWWDDGEVQRTLMLSRKQVDALQHEFERGLDDRRELRRQLMQADEEVDAALAQGVISDDNALILIGKAEELRYRRNVARTLLLARMYRLLTPEQRTRLKEIVPPVRR